jgi:hypothetical protein
MPSGYIYDPIHHEFYVDDRYKCETCENEAVEDGLCRDCLEERENDDNNNAE